MALENQFNNQEEPEDMEAAQGTLSEEEEKDLRLMVVLAENLIDDEGIDIIHQALRESEDPPQVIGQFLIQLVAQIDEQLPDEIEISPNILFAHGGWVEQISDFLQEEYDISKRIMDRVETYVATTAQQMAAAKQPQQAASQQPVPPQGAVV